jgi:hypothetical protein
MRRLVAVLALTTLAASPAAAQTLTTKDILDLTKAGLSQEALIALIDVHRSVFPVDRDTLMNLKAQGVSDNVIVAMIRSGRDPVPPPPPPPPAPTPSVIVDRGDGTPELIIKDRAPEQTRVVVVEERDDPRYDRRYAAEERVREVPVAVPVYVPVTTTRPRVRDREELDRLEPRPEPKRQEPVYWGFGGKLRPDAWKPSEPAKSSEPDKPRKKDS